MPESNHSITIRREPLSSSVSQSLIRLLNEELNTRYPEEGANFFHLSEDEVSDGRGGFFVSYDNDEPIGCGAVRMIEPGVAEIKRMYVSPTARGRGIGGRIVERLEVEVRALGAHRIVLETGPRQPDAIAMYTRAGFQEIPLFGEYIGSQFSVCMAKDLQHES